MDAKRVVVAYCRVSTLEQKRRGYGIEIQVRDVTLFAERQGLFLSRFYKDEAESGVIEDRKELKKLLRDCKAGKVGILIIPSLDRLSRDVRLAENLFHEFAKLGVEVLIADMPTYNGRDRKDVLIRQIREAIAEENRKDIIDRLWKGRQERVRRGLVPGGTLPYGYRRSESRVEVDTAESATVRTIFELAEEGLPHSVVAASLNEKGLRRRNGGLWTRRQVGAVLTRKLLYQHGTVHYGEAQGHSPTLIIRDRAPAPHNP